MQRGSPRGCPLGVLVEGFVLHEASRVWGSRALGASSLKPLAV